MFLLYKLYKLSEKCDKWLIKREIGDDVLIFLDGEKIIINFEKKQECF